jgi:hypothetical protein
MTINGTDGRQTVSNSASKKQVQVVVFCLIVVMKVALQWLLFWKFVEVSAFMVHPHTQRRVSRTLAAKGFGNTQKEERDTPKSKDPVVETTTAGPDFSTTTTTPLSTESRSLKAEKNPGQKALENLRRERQAQRDEELRKVRDIRNVDKMLQESPESGVIPEKVATRMGARMLPFVGIPLFGSLITFVGFWYLTTVKNLEIQPTVVGTTTSVLMVLSLFGITYSVLSASWEPEQEGSLLGVDEFKENLGNIKDGLKRARENSLVREKMQDLPEEEIQVALKELERREGTRTLENKINKELE